VISAFVVPFLAAILLAALAPSAARRLPPRVAVAFLTASALAVAGGTWIAIGGVLAATFAQIPMVASLGHWSPAVVREFAPFPFAVCVVASLGVGAVALRTAVLLMMDVRRLGRAWAVCRRTPQALVVLNDEAQFAYAVPGWPGRIVLSTGLLRSFSAKQRRAVLAHEQAHLDGHHELFQIAASACANANPLLRTLPAAVRLACERWSDEAAAASVGDRRTVALAIARAGSRVTSGVMTFAVAGSDVPTRVATLLSPPKGRRSWFIEAAIAGAALVAAAAACWMYRDLDRIFDAAAIRKSLSK